ncbi:NAD-dependent epimerase/dehydratase family protein [Flavobacterium sp. LC2016-01]|uniref:NAD-dependent epimerase/dehydratase family protein n=1 Tax=Flavobacterium sp. LC2016-01 TaxID=2675876 RepID=UPI0012BA7388|nr:NAD-dependent epimerase/dehydratase family protein [Flavobacterium sp. LC2016-01]MTH17518.1 NAD-dependent epimerase/dehydratase family protein [Flavobacterium sp. LC2016-01]
MQVWVSGNSGFVGKNLIQYLKDSSFEYCPITRTDFHDVSKLEFDVNDAIVHLAGKAHDLKATSNPDEYYRINFELTKKLYDEFLKSKAGKFIFVSSVKATADVVDGILTEEHLPNPQTHYGKSKLMAEEYIQNQPLPEGKSYYILRPCMIHGPGNKGNLNLLYKFVQKNIPYPLAAFDNKRSLLSVDNLCFVIKKLFEKNIPSGIYNVADDEPLSTNQIVSFLANSLNKKPKLWPISQKIIIKTAKIGDKIKLPLNTERLKKLTENYIVSNIKIKEALDIEFPLSSMEGLCKTAKAFKR